MKQSTVVGALTASDSLNAQLRSAAPWLHKFDGGFEKRVGIASTKGNQHIVSWPHGTIGNIIQPTASWATKQAGWFQHKTLRVVNSGSYWDTIG